MSHDEGRVFGLHVFSLSDEAATRTRWLLCAEVERTLGPLWHSARHGTVVHLSTWWRFECVAVAGDRKWRLFRGSRSQSREADWYDLVARVCMLPREATQSIRITSSVARCEAVVTVARSCDVVVRDLAALFDDLAEVGVARDPAVVAVEVDARRRNSLFRGLGTRAQRHAIVDWMIQSAENLSAWRLEGCPLRGGNDDAVGWAMAGYAMDGRDYIAVTNREIAARIWLAIDGMRAKGVEAIDFDDARDRWVWSDDEDGWTQGERVLTKRHLVDLLLHHRTVRIYGHLPAGAMQRDIDGSDAARARGRLCVDLCNARMATELELRMPLWMTPVDIRSYQHVAHSLRETPIGAALYRLVTHISGLPEIKPLLDDPRMTRPAPQSDG